MKTISFLSISLLLFLNLNSIPGNQASPDPELLVGTWKLDMSPQDKTDDNFAMMRIEKIKDNGFKGTFYREGVKIREGKWNAQRGVLYGALISGDNSGEYNTSFYYYDGLLYGSTHAIQRGFLSVWIATKVD